MFLIATLGVIMAGAPASAQEEVPYWASLRTEKANMRVGPSESYRIVWVYQREGLPLKVIRRLSGWRLVEDPDGERGWVVSRFLSLERSAIIVGEELAEIHAAPDGASTVSWRAEPGVTGDLGECINGWCRFVIDRREGWVEANRLWGSGEP